MSFRRHFSPTVLERLVALFVIALVAIGVGAKIYEGYADRRTQAYLAFHDILWEHWAIELVGDADDVAAAIAADDRVPITRDALEHARREAEAQGTEFQMLREWSAVITNPRSGAHLEPSQSLSHAGYNVRAYVGTNPDTPSVLIEGAMPVAPGEIALSATAVAELGLSIGDSVELSHPERTATAQYTLVGTLRPRAGWVLPYDVNIFAQSEAPFAIVSWEGSEALYEAAQGMPRVPAVVINWNGDSPAFEAISSIVAGPGEVGEYTVSSDIGTDRIASGSHPACDRGRPATAGVCVATRAPHRWPTARASATGGRAGGNRSRVRARRDHRASGARRGSNWCRQPRATAVRTA